MSVKKKKKVGSFEKFIKSERKKDGRTEIKLEKSEKTRNIKEPFIMHPLNKRLKSLVCELNFANKIEFVNLKKN